MSYKEFNPSEYKNKKTIKVRTPGYPGVFRLMDWSVKKKQIPATNNWS